MLSEYLKLDVNLSSEYNIFEHTGTPRYGDFSDYINEGKIIKERKDSKIKISEETMTSCTKAYNDCYRVLANNSIHKFNLENE